LSWEAVRLVRTRTTKTDGRERERVCSALGPSLPARGRTKSRRTPNHNLYYDSSDIERAKLGTTFCYFTGKTTQNISFEEVGLNGPRSFCMDLPSRLVSLASVAPPKKWYWCWFVGRWRLVQMFNVAWQWNFMVSQIGCLACSKIPTFHDLFRQNWCGCTHSFR